MYVVISVISKYCRVPFYQMSTLWLQSTQMKKIYIWSEIYIPHPLPHNNKQLNSENFWMHGIMVKIWSTGFVVHTNLAFWESKIGVIKWAVHEIPCPWRLMDLMNKKERTETVQLPPILLFLFLWQLKIKCPLTQILSSGISALGKTKQRSGGPHVCSVS